MFRFLRRHRWVLIAAMALTCVSFVFFMSSGPGKYGRGGVVGNYGTIYGHELTADEIEQAKRDFNLEFLVNYGEWPEKAKNVTENQIEQRTYVNLMFAQKAKSLGISVPDDVVADGASQMLRSQALARYMGTPGQAVPMDKFEAMLKQQANYTDADFQHSVRSQLITEQLRIMLGLSGSFVTPQEAATLYDRENQEAYAQVVFFSMSNYLDHVTATPAAVGEFFTNNMAYYRLPDRLQVNYVWFNVTNFLATAKEEVTKTNFDQTVNGIYQQYGATEFKDYKTPEEAKAKIREIIIHNRALKDAEQKAEDFKSALYAMDPPKADNILTLAKQGGLTAKTSAPFSEGGQSDEFAGAPAVTKTAFTLNADSPFSDLIVGDDGIYIIGVANQLPSSIPSLGDILPRVEADFATQSALAMASKAGTNFYITATIQMAAGKTFAQAAVAQGHTPVILSPFSLSSTEVPEAGDRAQVGDLKQAAFTALPGHVNRFMSTADGGFVLYLQKIEPADMAKKKADLPAFISQIRRGRESEAFNIWVNNEAGRELRGIPAFEKTMSSSAN